MAVMTPHSGIVTDKLHWSEVCISYQIVTALPAAIESDDSYNFY